MAHAYGGFDITQLDTYPYAALRHFNTDLCEPLGMPLERRSAAALRANLQAFWDFVGDPALAVNAGGPQIAQLPQGGLLAIQAAIPPGPPAPPGIPIMGAIVLPAAPPVNPAAPPIAQLPQGPAAGGGAHGGHLVIPAAMPPWPPTPPGIPSLGTMGAHHAAASMPAPPLLLDAMFAVPSATDHEDIWRESFDAIQYHLSTTNAVFLPLRDLQAGSMSQLRKGDFILLFRHQKCFIYRKDGDDAVVSLRSSNLGTQVPPRSQLWPHVGVYILTTDAILYFRHLAATNPDFSFDDCTSHKRAYTVDQASEQQPTPNWNKTFFNALSTQADDTSSRSQSARARGLTMTAAASLSANPDRVLKSGIFQIFQKLLNSAYLHTQTDIWKVTVPFSIQLQPGHLLHLVSSWASLSIHHFASLDDHYGSIQAAAKTLCFYQSSKLEVDESLPVDKRIIGNDISRFIRALKNYAYVLDTVYSFHDDIRAALLHLCDRIEAFIRPRTQG